MKKGIAALLAASWLLFVGGTDVVQAAVAPEIYNLQERAKLLEAAIAPDTPEQAARLWMEGLRTRNGALQWALLASRLRTPERLRDYEIWHWHMPGSSPWMESYNLREGVKLGEDRKSFFIRFRLTDSTGVKIDRNMTVVVEKTDGHWYVVNP